MILMDVHSIFDDFHIIALLCMLHAPLSIACFVSRVEMESVDVGVLVVGGRNYMYISEWYHRAAFLS